MARDLKVNPYYSDHESQFTDKNYKVVLSKPGKALQARELIEAQELGRKQLQSNFDTMYKNGSIVEGCDISVIDDGYGNYTVFMSAGKFYYDGRVLSVPTQSLSIVGSGDENLGLYVNETFISVSEDSTLTDPASGYSNYGIEGADRLQVDVVLVKVITSIPEPRPELPSTQKYDDENNLTTIWNLTDAVVQNYIRKPDYSLLTQVLAKRTFDESGNYLVEGMKLETAESDDSTKIKVIVNPGICYVKGFDNTFIVPRSIDVNKALTTQAHANEPHTYGYGDDYYTLIHPFVVLDPLVHDVIVTALVIKSIIITRGSGDYDAFDDIYGNSFSSIESILDISGYTQGVDYELTSDMIHWIGAKPSTGVTYTADFRYYKTCVRGASDDFTVTQDPDSDNDVYAIFWTGVGDVPADGTSFLVDYYSYKARTDLISIDKFGNIIQKEGETTNYDKTLIPPFNNEMLPLGWIKFLPGCSYDRAIINEYNFKRTTMFQLHYMKKRIDDLEANVAALALESDSKEGEESTTLKGIFVDPFNGWYRCDAEHSEFNCAMNLLDGELLLQSEQQLVTLNRSSDVRTNISTWVDDAGNTKFLTLQKTGEVSFFSNTLKSDVMNLNPHGFIKKSPAANLNPDRDEWIAEEIIETTVVENQVFKTEIPSTKTKFSKSKEDSILGVFDIQLATQSLGVDTVGYEKTEITDRIETFARIQTINVKGRNFEPASKVTAIFGGRYVPLVAVSPYRNEMSGGSSTGKMLVGSDGSFNANFSVPTGTRTGDIELRLVDEHDNIYTTIFRSKGLTKIIENRTVITKIGYESRDVYDNVVPFKSKSAVPHPTPPIDVSTPTPAAVWNRKENVGEDITRDPLAQSFIFKDDKLLVALDVFFATKADDNPKPVTEDEYYNTSAFTPTIPAILTIGYMKNGFPDHENLIHTQEIIPTQITTSLYGTTPTHITLTKPVFIPAMQDFFISIGSKSTEYTVYVAVLGESDLDTGNLIMKNPYQDGNLFTSSNGITWTPVQDRDMSIVLYEGTYSSSGSIVFENISFPTGGWAGYGRFIFTNNYVEIPETKAQYYYSINGGTTWIAFNPSEEINTNAAGTQLQIKCTLTGKSGTTNLSPILSYFTNLIFFKYDVTQVNAYRTKEVTDLPAYNGVKMIIDEYVAGSMSANKEFSTEVDETGQIWFRLVHDPVDSIDLGNGYYKKTYVFDFYLLQRLTVVSTSGFAVGNDVSIQGFSDSAKVVAIDDVNLYIWTLLNNDGETRFADTDVLDNGTVTTDIDVVYDYDSEPAWPVRWTGKILLESTNYWATPIIKNYRSIMRAL